MTAFRESLWAGGAGQVAFDILLLQPVNLDPLQRKHSVLAIDRVFTELIKNEVCPNPGFPGGSVVKNPPASAGDLGSIPGLGRTPGKGNGNPLQYSCLENPMDSGTWRATVHGVTKSQT